MDLVLASTLLSPEEAPDLSAPIFLRCRQWRSLAQVPSAPEELAVPGAGGGNGRPPMPTAPCAGGGNGRPPMPTAPCAGGGNGGPPTPAPGGGGGNGRPLRPNA